MKKSEKPNIILIVLDSVRADHLSLFGYKRDTTPFLNSIKNDLIICKNAFTTAPWTLPSHISLFTGLYPGQIIKDSQKNYEISFKNLPSEIITIQDILKKNGYKCFAISTNPVLNSYYNLFDNFEEFFELFKHHTNFWGVLKRLLNKFKRDIIHSTDFGAKNSLKIIKNIIDEQKSPYFIFVNLIEAHHPYSPIFKLWKYTKIWTEDKFPVFQTIRKTHNMIKFYHKVPEKIVEEIKVLYDIVILYLDEWLKSLWILLEKKKLLKNTIIIITSDHGENFGEKGYVGHKYMLGDSLIKIPLIFYNLNSPKIVNKLVQITDIFPTLLNRLGIKVELPYTLNAIDILSSKREYILAEDFPKLLTKKLIRKFNKDTLKGLFLRRLRCIRTVKYKLIRDYTNNLYYLYDVINDPYEKNNLVDKEKEIFKFMKNMFDKAWKDIKLISQEGKEVKIDKEVKKRLEELGYL